MSQMRKTVNHTFKGSKGLDGYGYYAYLEGLDLVIGESWPREGGETYRGPFSKAEKRLAQLKIEAPQLHASILKYYAEHPEKPEKPVRWIKVAEHSALGVTLEEFVDDSGKFFRQLWNDGHEEIFRIE